MTLNTTTLGTHIRITGISGYVESPQKTEKIEAAEPEEVLRKFFSSSLIRQVKIFAEYLVRIDEMCLIMILTA